MTPLKTQFVAASDPLVVVSSKVPSSVIAVAKVRAEELGITLSELNRLALEQYIDRIQTLDLALKMDHVLDSVATKAIEITAQNVAVLKNQQVLLTLLNAFLDENVDLDNRVLAEIRSQLPV